MRDTNRGRLYTAEQSVRSALKRGALGGTATGDDITFASVVDAQAYLDDVLRPEWENKDQRKRYRVTVFEKPKVKGNSHSTYYAATAPHGMPVPAIGLYPGWGFTGLVLTHEYAHHLVRLVGDTNNVVRAVPSHGSEYARMFLSVVAKAYDGTAIPALLEDAFDKQRVLLQPFAQRDAARKQVLRLRSDVVRAFGESKRTIPTSFVVFANDPDDYFGNSYGWTDDSLNLASTLKDELHFGSNVKVTWRQLRYFEAPMVRER